MPFPQVGALSFDSAAYLPRHGSGGLTPVVTADTRFRSRVGTREIRGWQVGTGTRLRPCSSVLSSRAVYLFTHPSIHIIVAIRSIVK